MDAENHPWPFLAFVVPKKDGTTRLVIDFRKLSTMLVWSEYPLLIIDNLIQFIMGFHFVTGLDVSMRYLSMPLDEPSKVILTIVMPFGLFKC